jgi:hypothetical protein
MTPHRREGYYFRFTETLQVHNIVLRAKMAFLPQNRPNPVDMGREIFY